jgi:hypothetical protein
MIEPWALAIVARVHRSQSAETGDDPMFTFSIFRRQNDRTTTPRPEARRRPSVEALEGRQLLTTFTPLDVKKSVAVTAVVGNHIGVATNAIQGNHIGVATSAIQGNHIGVATNAIQGNHIGVATSDIVGQHIG